MNYQEAVTWLKNTSISRKLARLDRFPLLLEMLEGNTSTLKGDHPKFVHVTGTNGKGSTCVMTSSILKEAGYKTGLFTSPHIAKYNERVKVNGKDIPDEDFARLATKVRALLDKLTEEKKEFSAGLFEIVLLIAFMYFKEVGVDYIVLEVGVGGEKDPTNAIQNSISLITNIDLDHTHLLGNTKEEIAHTKAGIIKEGSLCITTEKEPELIEVIAKRADEKNAKLIVVEEGDVELLSESTKGQVCNIHGIKNIELPLLGSHQRKNAALAVMCAQTLKIEDAYIKAGIKNAVWPLRMQRVINPTHKEVLIDGAHTLDAFTHVVPTIKSVYKGKKITYILGFAKNKNWQPMCDYLIEQIGTEVCLVPTRAYYKGLESNELAEYLTQKGCSNLVATRDISEAFKESEKNDSELACVIGSLYLASDALQFLTS